MKLKDRYSFPAIFHYADDGISIEFPDLPGCFPCADTTQKAFAMAKDAMGLHLWGMEQDGNPIPAPSDIKDLKLGANDVPAMIEVFMPAVRARVRTTAVKKTVTLPAWMNAAAEEHGVNFSATLQNALVEQLGLQDPTRPQA